MVRTDRKSEKGEFYAETEGNDRTWNTAGDHPSQ